MVSSWSAFILPRQNRIKPIYYFKMNFTILLLLIILKKTHEFQYYACWNLFVFIDFSPFFLFPWCLALNFGSHIAKSIESVIRLDRAIYLLNLYLWAEQWTRSYDFGPSNVRAITSIGKLLPCAKVANVQNLVLALFRHSRGATEKSIGNPPVRMAGSKT